MVEGKDKLKSGLDLLILQEDLFIVTPDKMENKTGSQAGLYWKLSQRRRECNVKGRICTHKYKLRVFRGDLKDIEGKE